MALHGTGISLFLGSSYNATMLIAETEGTHVLNGTTTGG